ncbi:MAG: 16S rRNA (cytosine(1402)-N(4))-methyltransferase, partial [Sphingobacteriales bacterium]
MDIEDPTKPKQVAVFPMQSPHGLSVSGNNLFLCEGEYGIKTGETMNASNIGMTNAAIEALNLHDGDNILEIGHGNGGHIADLLSKAENLKYFGADISETIIAEAKRLNQDFLTNETVNFH